MMSITVMTMTMILANVKNNASMKKFLFIALAFLFAFVSCSKESNETPVVKDNVVSLTFTSKRPQLKSESKTAWDEASSSIVWSATDKIKVGFTFNDNWWAQNIAYSSENENPNDHIKFYQSDAVTIDENNSSIGTFSVPATFTGPADLGSYVFYAVYPNTAIENNNDGAPNVKVTLKSSQIPAANSFDGSADILVGKSDAISSEGFPEDPIEITWNRVVAHGLFTLKNFQGVQSDETVMKVVLTAQEGANLTGKQTVSISNGTVTATNESSNEVTLSGSGLAFVTEGSDVNLKVWLSVIPVTLTSLKVEVYTNKSLYVREITNISKTLKQNACNKLAIKMDDADKTPQTEYDWVKKSLSAITSSDVFVIVGNNGANYAMNHYNLNSDGAPIATAVSVSGNKLSSSPSDNLQWNLTSDSNGYMFYPNGVTNRWLNLTNNNNGLRVSSNSSNGKYWSLDNTGYLKGTDTQGNTRYLGIYNSTDWRSYKTTGGNIEGQTFAFYVRTTKTPSKPAPTITFSDPTTTVNVGEKVTNVATIDPSSLSITYSSSNSAIATVNASTGEVTGVSEGSATITASFAGNEDYDETSASYTINVEVPVVIHGSVDNPLSPSDIVTVINALGDNEITSDFYYVEGIVSEASTKLYSGGKLSFSFGESTDVIKAYNCLGLNGAAFTSVSDVAVGDYVVVYGNLEKYVKSGNITYEVVNGQLARITHTEAAVTLESITVSGQNTTFTQGDSFAFGGTATAHYSDGSTKNVTNSVSCSGYDLSVTGNQTVIVSYTEEDVTKTTTYQITVNPAGTVTEKTATILFGNAEGSTNINNTSITGSDNQGNSWTITTVMTENSFTPQPGYAQIGSAKKPATSITFTTTLSSSVTVKSFSAKFGGFSGTAGNVELKVDNNVVGTGSLNEGNDVTVQSNTTANGTVLTVTVTDIAKGVKAYNIIVTYE